MRLTLRRRLRDSDEGTTLVELLVVMIVFTMIMGIITSAIVNMVHQSQRESGQTNNLNSSRKVITLLDHSVRYANAITAPGTGTDGNLYFEFRTGNIGQQQMCTQWRYIATGGKMQWRTWLPPSATATTWATAAIGMTPVGATPVFTISATSTFDNKEELNVGFNATSGAPPTTSASQVTVTAINSTSASPPAAATCTEVGRP
jgi:type II secretory pathway pseudopilin PulG